MLKFNKMVRGLCFAVLTLGFNVLNFNCETHVISLKLEVTIAILNEGYFQLAKFL